MPTVVGVVWVDVMDGAILCMHRAAVHVVHAVLLILVRSSFPAGLEMGATSMDCSGPPLA